LSSTLELRPRKKAQDGTENILTDLPLMAAPIPAQHGWLGYLELLWEQRQLLFRGGLCAVVASTLLALLLPVRYQAATRLMPPDMQSSPGMSLLAGMSARSSGGASALNGLAGDLLGVKSSGALFVGLLGSETILDRLVAEFQLQALYRDSKIEDARVDLSEHTSISEDRKSGIILITVRDHDAKRAAAMADAYVTELDRLVSQLSTSSARRERIFLEERLKQVKAELDTAAKNFSDFASKNTAIDIPAQGKAMVEAAATLQGQLIASQAQLSSLQQIYSDSNVRVLAARARVNELEKSLNAIGGSGTPDQVMNDKSLYPSIRRLPLLGVTYADLYQQTKIQQTVYELLTQQYELAKVQEAKEIPSVKVLDPAMVPTKKSFPPRTLIVLLGTMLGAAGAMLWIVARARWKKVPANDPRKVFATAVFATAISTIANLSQNGNGVGANGNWQWSHKTRAETNGVDHKDTDKEAT
jgi:capsule polysaccharide export protein KpsE/RkpR